MALKLDTPYMPTSSASTQRRDLWLAGVFNNSARTVLRQPKSQTLWDYEPSIHAFREHLRSRADRQPCIPISPFDSARSTRRFSVAVVITSTNPSVRPALGRPRPVSHRPPRLRAGSLQRRSQPNHLYHLNGPYPSRLMDCSGFAALTSAARPCSPVFAIRKPPPDIDGRDDLTDAFSPSLSSHRSSLKATRAAPVSFPSLSFLRSGRGEGLSIAERQPCALLAPAVHNQRAVSNRRGAVHPRALNLCLEKRRSSLRGTAG